MALFVPGRAEYMLPNMLKKHQSNVEQVAVVDPPRAGLHNKAIHALRFVLTNLISLSR